MGSIENPKNFYTEALVIGAGFSGIYSLHKLRKAGIPAKLVEAGTGFGGVWHWNRYPGARVDSEAPLYQLNIPEVWKTWNYTERFPDHYELRRYFEHVDKVLDLSKDTIFQTIVQGVSYKDGIWTCNTKAGGVITCKYLLLCTGSSYKKHFPDFKNMSKYTGKLIHASEYPDGQLDVTGKRVAIIGNGATGVQLTQTWAKLDCQLTAYIRTPNTCLPMMQRPWTPTDNASFRTFQSVLLNTAKLHFGGFPYNGPPGTFAESTPEIREKHFEELWARGGFSILAGNYTEYLVDKTANAFVYDFWAKKVRARIQDPVKRDIVAPVPQEHWFGVKRASLEQDYYESIDRPNVEIVSLKKNPIVEFSAKGIVTADKERAFDVVVLATGYDALTGSLLDLEIQDKNGVALAEKWKDGVETHLGLMIPGMPNAFMVYSPQAPTALSNGPPIIEIQVDWIVDALAKMKEEGITSLDSKIESAKKWNADIQTMNSYTLFPLEDSWYMGANIPGKKREQLLYVAGVDVYGKVIADALKIWDGFELIK